MKDFISSIEMKENRVRRSKIIEQLELLGCDYMVQTYPFEHSDEEGHNIIVTLGDSEQKIVVSPRGVEEPMTMVLGYVFCSNLSMVSNRLMS